MSATEDPERTLRPTWGSYCAFGGIWVVLAAGYGLLALRRPESNLGIGVAIAALAACASLTWIAGHRIRVSGGVLHYRDGFFRSRRIRLADIERLSASWTESSGRWIKLRIPSLTVVARDGARSVQLNPKPFARKDLQALLALVNGRPGLDRG